MTPVETLRSELHPDGKTHARYPTAELTLCGRRVLAGSSSSELPDCGSCSRTARLFDRVDGSMPRGWRASSHRWTRAEVVASMLVWHEQTGAAPKATDWDRVSAVWPNVSACVRLFGSWGDALRAAGFEPLPNFFRRTGGAASLPDASAVSLVRRLTPALAFCRAGGGDLG